MTAFDECAHRKVEEHAQKYETNLSHWNRCHEFDRFYIRNRKHWAQMDTHIQKAHSLLLRSCAVRFVNQFPDLLRPRLFSPSNAPDHTRTHTRSLPLRPHLFYFQIRLCSLHHTCTTYVKVSAYLGRWSVLLLTFVLCLALVLLHTVTRAPPHTHTFTQNKMTCFPA